MTPLAILVKASLLLGVAAVTHAVFGRRMSAAMRHQLWTLTAISLLLLPVFMLVLPGWTAIRVASPAPVGSQLIARSFAPDPGTTPAASMAPDAGNALDEKTDTRSSIPAITWPAALGTLYLLGVVFLLARLARQILVLGRLSRRATEAGTEWELLLAECAQRLGVPPLRLIRSLDRTIPMAFGFLKPAIVIPAIGDAWPEDRRRAVLLHELAHVARHDCLTQLLAVVVCAIYWMHPGVWWMARRLRVERELACDDLVLAAGTGPRDYAAHLLEIAYALRPTLATALSVSMASRRQLEGRMLAVLDGARNRATPTIRIRLFAALLMTASLVLVATAHVMSASTAAGPVADTRLSSASADALETPVQTTAPATIRQERRGTWEIRPVREADSVHLRMSDGESFYGNTVGIDSLSGLAPSLLTGAGGPAGFSLRRDAGTFTFEGLFRNGVGAGTYTFIPNAAFVTELARRGYERPTADQLERMARANMGTAFLDELATQGYRGQKLAQIIRAADHGVDPRYLREMGQLGYRAGTLEALVDMRDHGVTPSYINGLAAQGLAKLSADDVVRARDHGVTPEFIRDMAQFGIRLQSLPALVNARDHGVSPEYVREMRSRGYTLTVDELVRARDHGVSVDYVTDLQKLGYQVLPMETLIRLRDHGVSPEYINDLAQIGYARLSVDDLVSLRDHGVSPDQVRRANARAGSRLSVDRLRELASRGWR